MKRGPSVRPGVRAVIASMAAAVWPSAGAHRHRYFYVAFAIFQCFLGAGIIFGWTSLLPMLEAERVYNELCAPGERRAAAFGARNLVLRAAEGSLVDVHAQCARSRATGCSTPSRWRDRPA